MLNVLALRFASASPDFSKRLIVFSKLLRLFSRLALIATGGARSGTAKFGAFGSASTTNGAAEEPRCDDPALLCALGRQTYGGNGPRGPYFLAITEPCEGCWLLGLRPELKPDLTG